MISFFIFFCLLQFHALGSVPTHTVIEWKSGMQRKTEIATSGHSEYARAHNSRTSLNSDISDTAISYFVQQQFSKIDATSYKNQLNSHNHVLVSALLLVVHELSLSDISIIQVKNVDDTGLSLRRSLSKEEASSKNSNNRIWIHYRISIPNIYQVGFLDHEDAYNTTSQKLLHSIHHTNTFNHFFTTLAETSEAQALTDVVCTDIHIFPYSIGLNSTSEQSSSKKATANIITTYSVVLLIVFLLIIMIGFTRVVYRLNKIKCFDGPANRVYPIIELESFPAATVVMITPVFSSSTMQPTLDGNTTSGSETDLDATVIAQAVENGISMDMTAIAYPASSYYHHASVTVPDHVPSPTLRNALSYYTSRLDSQRYIPITPRPRTFTNQTNLSVETVTTTN